MKIGSKKKWAVGALVASPFLYAAVRSATDRSKGSLTMRGASTALRLKGNQLRDLPAFIDVVRSTPGRTDAPVPNEMRSKLNVAESVEGGHRVVTLSPKSQGSRWQIIYLHGGAYVNPLVKEHWDIIASLIAATGATVTVPLYPLAPEGDSRAARSFVNQVYQRVVEGVHPEHLVLVGDSAGGGLVVGTALEAKAKGLPPPARMILFAPWLDLTLANPAARTVEPHDIMLGIESLRQCGRWWAGESDPAGPVISPLYADLAGLPPIDIFQGTADLLVVDCRSFVTKARLAGIDTRYFEYPNAFHVFMAATFIPEAKDVYRIIGNTLSPERQPPGV